MLAAGLGTRLRPYTDQVAKPAIPFFGLPQILYPYYFLKDLNIKNITYNTHHLPESVNDVFRTYEASAHGIYEPQLLDSAGGLYNARESLTDECFMMVNADSLFIYQSLEPILEAYRVHKQEKRLATLFVIDSPGAGKDFSGLWSNSEAQLQAAGIEKNITGASSLSCSHFIGVYIFSQEIFSHITCEAKNIIHDYLVPLAQQGFNVHITKLENFNWYELGKVADYKTNHKLIEQNLKEGLYSPSSSFLKAQQYFNGPLQSGLDFKAQGIEAQILSL